MKNKYLTLWDWLILTLILLGEAIIVSTQQYVALIHQTTTIEEAVTFTSEHNWMALRSQLITLLIALAYLWIRRFDFSVIFQKIRFNRWVPLQAIAIYIISAIVFDIYYLLASYGQALTSYPSVFELFREIDWSVIIYALLNGFYEEFYFLGLCFCVKDKYIPYIIFASIIVRISFHTYQGLISAIGIGVIYGLTMLLLYHFSKKRNLLPFFLGHAIADVIGLSLMYHFWY